MSKVVNLSQPICHLAAGVIPVQYKPLADLDLIRVKTEHAVTSQRNNLHEFYYLFIPTYHYRLFYSQSFCSCIDCRVF
jgi:hypothetical protein